jgi:hypothetical protein
MSCLWRMASILMSRRSESTVNAMLACPVCLPALPLLPCLARLAFDFIAACLVLFGPSYLRAWSLGSSRVSNRIIVVHLHDENRRYQTPLTPPPSPPPSLPVTSHGLVQSGAATLLERLKPFVIWKDRWPKDRSKTDMDGCSATTTHGAHSHQQRVEGTLWGQ